jgi:hypothetical protein
VRRLCAGIGGGAVAAALTPAPALAHGLIGKTDLPIPQWLFAWAAAIVLVVSFVALATLWPKARLASIAEHEVLRVPGFLEPLCGLIGIALFAIVVYAGLAGAQVPTGNILPTWIFVIFWVGLAFTSGIFGNVFRPFNPWRAFARGAAWLAARAGRTGSEPLRYPERLGYWPAVLFIVGFGWLELVYVNRDIPSTLAVLALAYAAVQLVGMSLFGIDTWTERGDGFSVYFRVFSRIAPLDWHGGRLWRRPPFIGAMGFVPAAGSVALLTVMVAVTSFDGFSFGSAWVGPNGIYNVLVDFFTGLGIGIEVAGELAGTLGLALMVCIIGGFYRLGILGMRSLGGGHTTRELSHAFLHTLIPIALAYVVAHYFSLLIYSGQAIGYLASDPLGNGANIFGTAAWTVNYKIVSANVIWYVQVGALLIGHVAALTLAHDRALTMYRRPSDAARSQYWMLAVMVGFTSLGLWILSSTY